MELREILQHFDVDRRISETSYQCKCPVHGDKKASLTISEKDGKILLHCHAGCDTEDILHDVGLSMEDLILKPTAAGDFGQGWQKDLEDIYDYFDDQGEYVYSKLRYKGKKMVCGVIEKGNCSFKNIPKGRYLYNAKRIRESLQESPKKPVYIVEGEKDVDTLTKIGLIAATAGGVNQWQKSFSDYFKSAYVVILPDNDEPGQKLVKRIVKDIKDVCHAYKVVETSNREHGDVTDYLQEGHSKEELLKLVGSEPWTVNGLDNLDLKTMADVTTKQVEWFVFETIPKNQLTTFGGDGGSAKTSMWCSIVADVSNGRCTVFEKSYCGDVKVREGQKVLFFSSEDPIEEVLKPRLQKYNACMENIKFIDLKDERFKLVKFNSKFLENLIAYHRPALVVFDPLQSFIPEDVQMGSRNAMRSCLNPLVGICNKYGATVIIIAHANKAQGVWGRRRLADSADIWDLSRSVFLFGKLEKGMFYMSQEKNNYGALNKTLLFSLEDGKVTPKGFTDKHDKEFQQSEQYASRNAPAKEEAKEFILEQLTEHGGNMDHAELMEMAEVMSISENAMKGAKTLLKKEGRITLKNTGFTNKKFIVSLTAIVNPSSTGDKY